MKIENKLPQAKNWVGASLLLLLVIIQISAQNSTARWLEMPRKDAEKLLANSPWSQTQVDTDTSEMFYSPTRQGSASPGRSNSTNVTTQQSVNNNRADRGAVNEEIKVTYRICFLSARPIREAFAKMILLSQGKKDQDLVARLQAFVERDFSNYIVIGVDIDSSDKRFLGPVMQLVNSATAGTLKNNTYLEREDGKRLFLSDYIAPIPDGLGAKFIFPRLLNGQPFLTTASGSVRFVAEFDESFKLNMRYKVSDMIFENKLEY